jgi:pilus assembly protein Flp/PilA
LLEIPSHRGSGEEWDVHPAQFSGGYELRSQAMNSFKQAVIEFIREEEGLTVVEYAVAGGLVSLGVIVAFTELGENVDRIIDQLVLLLPL